MVWNANVALEASDQSIAHVLIIRMSLKADRRIFRPGEDTSSVAPKLGSHHAAI